MSLRDEMVSKAQGAYRRGFAPGEIVDDLMPLVERAVKAGVWEMASHCVAGLPPNMELSGKALAGAADAIVARVTGKGDL